MSVNKVTLTRDGEEEVLIDISGDTVTPDVLLYGVTAHNAQGEPVTGNIPEMNQVIVDNPGMWVSGEDTLIVSNEGTLPYAQYLPIGSGIDMFVPLSNFGDLSPDQVPAGMTFTSVAGLCVEGTGLTSDGYYDQGYNDAFATAYSLGKAPLMIQGFLDRNEDGLYNIDDFGFSIVGESSHTFYDYASYEVVTSSKVFTVSAINNTEIRLRIVVYAQCEFNLEDGTYSEEETFSVVIDPDSSNSAELVLGEGGSQHIWEYKIEGVEFFI